MFSVKSIKSALAVFTASVMLFSSAVQLPFQTVSAADTCVIDTTSEYQMIRGFGGINHPEWTGQDLTDSQRQTAFGNGDNELGMSVLRVYVNEDRNQWYRAVETAKACIAQGGIVFASPWNPPADMCETFTRTYTSWDGSTVTQYNQNRLRHDKYAEYAQHLNDFVLYMRENGVDLYAISIQNEPDYAEEWTWWTSDECVNFLENYAHVIDCRVMSPETFQYNKEYYNKILNNSTAFENTDLFGTHFYGTQRSQMDFPALESCGKEIWMTEVYVPNSEADSNDRWPEAIQVSENIHNGLVVGNMSAYVWWYIRRNYGPMKEDGTISKRGYCMAQFSKYVRPGDVRIGATEIPADNVYISAYKGSDNQVTIVAINKGTEGYSQNFSFSGGTITDVDRYRTSASENLAETQNLENDGTSFWAQLPAESVSTFVVTMADGSMTLPDEPDVPTPVVPEPDENGYFFHDTFEQDTFEWNGRGAATVMTSGRTAYAGSEALLVQERTAAWNGAYKALNSAAFVPGEAFSFSAEVMYFDGNSTDTFYMKLQYTDANGDTQYSTIAEATAVKGQWVQLANTSYTIPADATDMQIYIETADSTNNFYIDEAIGAVEGTVIDGPEQISFMYGDINCDGTIDVYDVIAARQGITGGFADSTAALAADVNQNGAADTDDLVQLQDYIMRRIDAFKMDETIIDTPIETPTVNMGEFTAQINAKMIETEPASEREEQSGVAYGTVQKVSYYSNTCKRNRNFNILLPAGYSEDKEYPVLYAMHGYWQNEDTLIDENDESMRLRQIIGNAIASGEAEDMIVVFPYIYASDTQDSCTAMDDANNAAYDNFINELTNDLMPYIESHYSVKTGKENTALTGFSMGGRESLYIAMKRPDLFGYAGSICPAPGVSPGLVSESDFKFTAESPYLLMLTAGSDDTVVYSSPEGYHNILTSNGVPHIWHYVNGGYHGGNSIRAHIYNFVRAVFKAE